MHAKSCELHCNGGVRVVWVVSLRRCARGKCMHRVANRIVMVLLRWLWVVGLRRCARGKCMQRVANRTVMVVSRWVWVVGLRCCARGKCIQQIALESDRKQRFQRKVEISMGKCSESDRK